MNNLLELLREARGFVDQPPRKRTAYRADVLARIDAALRDFRCDHTTADGECPVCGPDGEPHPDAPARQYRPADQPAAVCPNCQGRGWTGLGNPCRKCSTPDQQSEPMVTYRYDKHGPRFRQYKKDPLPPWAVDVQDEICPHGKGWDDCPDCRH